MKTKKSIWSVALSLIVAFALALSFGFNAHKQSVNAEEPEHITFEITVDDVAEKSIASSYASQLVVKYTVAENTGVDALQLKLDYNSSAFNLVKIETLKTGALGSATITNGTSTTASDENYDAYTNFTDLTETGANVVYENVNNTYTATNDVLIIAYFTVNEPSPATAYSFGFADINDVDTYAKDAYSTAWKNVAPGDDQSGTHSPVEIRLSTATVYVLGNLNLTLTGNTKVYNGVAATDAEITISNLPPFTAENEPVIELVWFDSDYNMLSNKPVNAGTYYVAAKSAATEYWNAYCGYTGESAPYTLTNYATYTITQKALTISFDTRSAQYKSFTNSTFAGYLGENGYCTITGLVGTETLTVALDATNILTASVGNYNYTSDILVSLSDGTAETVGLASNYFIDSITGTFTITQKEIELGDSVYAVFNNGSFDYDGDKHTISATIAEAYAPILSATYSGGEDNANGRTSVGISTITATFTISDSNYKFKDNVNTLTATLEIVQTALTQPEVDALVNAYVAFYAVDNGAETPENLLTIVNHAGSYTKTYDANSAYIGALVNTADQSKLSATVLYKDGEELATEKVATALNNFASYAKTNAGVYTVIITVQPATGYAFANNVNADYTITLTINKAALTISATSAVQYSDDASAITVDNGNGWVGTESYTTYNINNNTISADTLKDYVSSTYQNTMTAGTSYTLSWMANAETAIEEILFNYDVNLAVAENLVVAKKVINASAYDFTGYQGAYDGANHTLTVSGANSVITYTIASKGTVKNVADSGTYTATITLADANNYTFENGTHTGWTVDGNSATKSAAVSITTVELAINVAYTKTTATFTISGFVGEETESVLTNLAYLAGDESANISGNVYTINGYVANAITVSATSDNTNYTIASATLKNIRKVEYVAGSYDIAKSGEEPVLPATDLLFDGFTTVEPAAVALKHYTFNKFAIANSTNADAFDFTQAITENKTIYAIWQINNQFTLTLVYMVEGDASNLIQLAQTSYYSDDVINYNAELPSLAVKNWFKVQEWFTDSALTAKFVGGITLTEDTTLYANYKFNIGLGDVNGDGKVNANDITLYRQWIVGGYEMEVVETGNEWAKVNANDFDIENVYFIKRVADSNALTAVSTALGDNHLDIRDVSTIRMALVGGYGFSILEGKNVDGEELIVSRTVEIDTISQLLSVAASGTTAKPVNDITETLFVGSIANCVNDVVIDLNNKTITLKSLSIALAANNTGKIEIKNGTIHVEDGNGITLSAPSGSVILTNVTFYDKDGQFTLQAANQSLHFNNAVQFLKDDNGSEVPASVVIPASTHVVIEENATLVIEKIDVQEVADCTLTIDVAGNTTNNIIVNGEATVSGNGQTAKVETVLCSAFDGTDTTYYDSLQSAVNAAGTTATTITLLRNATGNGVIVHENQNITFDFNGYSYVLDGTTVGSTGTETNGFQLLKGATVAFKNGTLKTTTAKILIQNYANTTLDNFVVSGDGANLLQYVVSNNFGSLTVQNGSKILAYGNQVAFDLWYGMNAIYDDGITVRLKAGTEVVGAVEYGAQRQVAGWVEKTKLIVEDGAVWDKVITLTTNIALTNTWVFDFDCTLDLAGHNITANNCRAIWVKTGVLNIIGNGTISANGESLNENSSVIRVGSGSVADSATAASLTIGENVIVSTNKCYGITVFGYNQAALVVNGTVAVTGTVPAISGNGTSTWKQTDITINGSATVSATYDAAIYQPQAGVLTVKSGANVEGGTAIYIKSGNITIENGANLIATKTSYSAYSYNGNGTNITGDGIVIDNCYYPGENATVVLGENLAETITVAAEGAKKIATYWFVKNETQFAEAVAAGGEIILGADISGIPYVAILADTTLNLNGKNLSFNKWGLCVDTEAASPITLTINGQGNVNATYCLDAENGNILIVNGGNYTATECAVVSYTGGQVTINGGTFTSIDNSVISTNGSEGYGENVITVNGGTFNGGITTNGYIACGIYVANNDTVVVNGGTFNITNGVGVLARSGNTTVNAGVVFNMLGDNEISGWVGDKEFAIPSGYELVLDLKSAYPGGTPTINNETNIDVYVVVDGTYTFADSRAAFHAARGVYDNVILTADLNNYLYVDSDMNIYLNGHTVDTSATSSVAVYVVNGAKVTINGNGLVKAKEGCVMALNGSEFVINGGEYICYDNFVFGTNGTVSEEKGDYGHNTITINDGIFNGGITSAGYVACGVYVANSDTVVINGGTFNITNGVGVLARSGNTTVGANVVFNVTGDGTLGKVGDSKVTVPSGEVLVLDLAANYPGGVPTLVNNNSNYNIYNID